MSKDKVNVVYVYGTLRPGTGKTVSIPGKMYRLGWFPGVKLEDGDASFIQAERIEVSDERLAQLDRYEGYYEDNPGGSLYIRREYLDGWIYEFNGQVFDDDLIPGGDWLEYTGQEHGSAA